MDNVFYLLGIAWYTVHVGVPSFLTGYREGPQAMSAMAYPLQHLIDEKFKKQNLAATGRVVPSREFDRVYRGLFLMNVSSTYQTRLESDNLVRLEWPERTPVIVAPAAAPWVESEDLDQENSLERLLDEMVINPRNKSAERLFLKNLPVAEQLSTSPDVQVLDHRVWNQRVELDIRLSDPCFVRLAYAQYPYLRVIVNNSPVTPLTTVGGYIALKLEPGDHLIELVPHLSPLRKALLALDMILLLCASITLLHHWRKSRT